MLEVHILNLTTGQWVKNKLMRHPDPDATENLDEKGLATRQCPVGILLEVEPPGVTVNSRKLSDILIYGDLSPLESSNQQVCGTSSSPAMGLRVFAAPICASVVTKAQSLPTPPPTPSTNRNDLNSPGASDYIEFPYDPLAPSPKRKRVDTLFEAADQFHKKVRRKGVIAVSEYIDKSREASPMMQFPYLKVKKEPQNDNPSPFSVPSSREKLRPGPLAGRTPSLSRQASLVSRAHSKSVSGQKPVMPTTLNQKELSESQAIGDDIIAANKALLTRTILTCMRLYGYHRNTNTTRTKPEGSTTSPVPTGNLSTEPLLPGADTEEEYGFKAMYHATYRASTFALRKFLNQKNTLSDLDTPANPEQAAFSAPVLNRQRATDVVDSLLKLFCEEPG